MATSMPPAFITRFLRKRAAKSAVSSAAFIFNSFLIMMRAGPHDTWKHKVLYLDVEIIMVGFAELMTGKSFEIIVGAPTVSVDTFKLME